MLPIQRPIRKNLVLYRKKTLFSPVKTQGFPFSRLAEGNWEGNHGIVHVIAVAQVRLAEGNWEGNHGRDFQDAKVIGRLAEGNWEGNHGRRCCLPACVQRLAEGNWEGNHGFGGRL